MATRKFVTHLNLSQNELQNAVMQNLSTAPSNPKKGQHYFSTNDNTEYVYDGTSWVNALSQGMIYTFSSPLSESSGTVSLSLSAADIPDISATYVAVSTKGQANGVATLDNDGKVPTSQLPSYVDDVIDSYIVSGATALTSGWLSATDGGAALTPETGKIYVVLSSGEYQNKTYRWSGSTYVEISSSPAQATESTAGIAAIATTAEVSAGSNDTKFVTPLKLATAMSGAAFKETVTNGALTASGGVCTWTISTTKAPDCICTVRETSSGDEVYCEVSYGSSAITIKINSANNIAAGTYTAVIIG